MVLEGDVAFEFDGNVVRPAPGEELFIRRARGTRFGTSGAGESRWLHGCRR